ncbi:hypothetical protein E8D34_15040 [Nocardioides sp. GY 10113]|uniref:hypothetical protein n=1 Tax=Nocardioides sp. GY 10113 TaxID=2569761 RepID=UPI0010A755AC|nr:hypothetical protein [Nocardioides sp. GY 10113]TIC83873.1 hypothetical protein E8D34_15040 [Nocardioides sp. GY 10113]
MRTGRAEPGRSPARRRTLGVPVLLLSLLPFVACSADPPGPIEPTSAQLEADLTTVLRKRARAILDDDAAALKRTLAPGDAIRRQQATYLANLAQLPVEVLRYRVERGSVTADPDDQRSVWAVVQTSLQLEGYDAVPVRTRDRWRFTLGEHGRRYVLASTRDAAWEEEHTSAEQPWDRGPIRVEERLDALGIFDATTIGDAPMVLDAVSDGRFEVGLQLPEERSSAVDGDGADGAPRDLGTVVYVLSDRSAVDDLTGDTVGDPERADGLTIAIPSVPGDSSSPTAGFRISLNPRVLAQSASVRDRLVRHELTHALLGAEGRGAPLWITEGIAEYVSVQPMDALQRRLPAAALEVGAGASALPSAEDFQGPDAVGWYAVAWWVCEYVANTEGPSMLWVLLDELAGGADQAGVLADRLGLTEDQLVQRGVALMTSTYRR